MHKYKIRRIIKKNLSNIPGWQTGRKLIVIESDDWGSIRMPSLDSFVKLEQLGLDLRSEDAERYNLNDTLATSQDLEGLYEVLSNSKDFKGKNAVFTPVCIVANPDFQKIADSGFQKYYYEPFTTTLKRYPGCENSFELWKEGIDKELFVPQMHGREHLNVTAWIKALQEGEEDTMVAFNEGLWGFVPKSFPDVDYQAAFLMNNISELEYQRSIITDGLQLFEKIMGYTAEFFVPPNGTMNNVLNQTLVENAIKYRFASKIQYEPHGIGKTRKVYHYLGQKERNGLSYIIRNCFFEPSQEGKDWIDSCLFEIKSAFRWKKPAIISSHRVNYIGKLNLSNRDRGLRQLSVLLKEITKNWPEVEFITTTHLGELMNTEKNNE
ncbi:MAG: hypothetical protein JXB49_29545 [Bacteroidales bacterium]|nr:hypothetical protein [Bacteroidales bacterium]